MTKGETAVRDQLEEKKSPTPPTADGSFIVVAAGGRGEDRPQERLETWLDGDTCPAVEGDFYPPSLWSVIMLPVVS